MKIKDLAFTLRNWKLYRYWKKRTSGEDTCDMVMGSGYYFATGVLGANPKESIHQFKMRSGNIGYYKLLDYNLHSDPDDMIKSSQWMLLYYEGRKPINECTFREFEEEYGDVYNFRTRGGKGNG